MKVIRRYLSAEITTSTLLVFAALLMLLALFDLIHELGEIGKGSYRLPHIFAYVLLSVPGHIYELFPIAALIGTLFALAQLVANSEYTVMRVSGVSIPRMALTLVEVGLLFSVLTFVIGEFIAPPAEQFAQQLRAKAITGVIAQEFRSGLWVKDDRSFVNVAQVLPDSVLQGVKIYEFDPDHRLRRISLAQRAEYRQGNTWRLHEVVQTNFENDNMTVDRIVEADWHSVLEPGLLSVLMLVPEQMSAWALYSFVQHLRENNQQTSRHEIAFWNKLIYPFAVLVMMVLALPFAYYQQRAGGVGGKVFAGIMLGIGFWMLGRLFTYLGLLRDWPPFWSAILPTLMFLSLAMVMMWWGERR
ncbi:MAG: LPS export ABC transporter permease LptG [Betaproteobacteria bacterium]|nr:LPS export ABC transporter permease LptG [Betaproteobacteria bacterium]